MVDRREMVGGDGERYTGPKPWDLEDHVRNLDFSLSAMRNH